MTTPDSKNNLHISLRHPPWFTRAYIFLHSFALTCVVLAETSFWLKLAGCLLLLLSSIQARRFLRVKHTVSEIYLENNSVSLLVKRDEGLARLPVKIIGRPIVTAWFIFLVFEESSGKVNKIRVRRMWASFRSWLVNKFSKQTFSLVVTADMCAASDHAALRRFLLAGSYSDTDSLG